ncbi:Gfo/Idh/MocA family oxidoreductase [Actinoplanes sp. NPDC026619]|uniref:Gfo/Idh/MocA family protein n=1 Tax=Actinoplanes sp. NPDC026619 TaxID=3155798 RepID=UPI0033F72D8D
MSDAVRFGLVGFGSGGRIFHAPLLASAKNVDFVGVVTKSPERRAELATERPGLTAFDSIAAIAEAGAEAVAISTPAATHAELAREAIALGLAVVVDKPFALDVEQAKSVVDAAAEKGTLLSAYQNRRWDSDFRTVQKLLAEGALGTVRRFESRFERWAPERKIGAAGGGTLLDFGSHLVDQALLLHGPVARVYAELRGGELDDDFFAALHHVGGVESHLWGSWRQAAPGPRFRVSGSTAAYVIDNGMDGQEALLKAGKSPAGLGERWGVEHEHLWGRIHRGETSAPVPSERGRWDTFYPAFAQAVRGDGPVPVEPVDTLRVMAVLDAARQSARTGEAIRL